MIGIAWQRAKQEGSQIRSSSGYKAAAELADGVNEGDKAGVVHRCKDADVSQDLVEGLGPLALEVHRT